MVILFFPEYIKKEILPSIISISADDINNKYVKTEITVSFLGNAF